MRTIIAAIVMLAFAGTAWAEPIITGQARVIDADTLDISGQRIRLFGIDAPEKRQTCEGPDGVYECGRDASASLAALLRDRSVSCEFKDRDRYGRVVAVCSTDAGDVGNATLVLKTVRDGKAFCLSAGLGWHAWDGKRCRSDIGAAMVRQGWAVDYEKYSRGAYRAEQEAAKAEKLGMWSGTFQMPEDWRKAKKVQR